MAEVTRGAAGFHSLSSKKPPSFSNNGYTISSSSSSSKHIYDDVFASRPLNKFKSSELSSYGDDDFAEIFGSSKSENGLWQSPSSSIPIFNIPDSEPKGYGSRGGGGGDGGEIDYSGVFGRVGDDNFALPDGRELFDQLKKKAKTSASASISRSKEQTTEPMRSHISRQSENGQRPTRGFSQSFDSVTHFEHHIEMAPNEPNKATHVVHVHAMPGSMCPPHEVGPSKKTQASETPMIEEDADATMGVYLAKRGKHSRSTGSKPGASEQKREHDVVFPKSSCLNESNSIATSRETCRANTVAGPSELVKEGAKVQCEVKDDAGVAVPGSISSHEVRPSQKTQTYRTPMTKNNAELGISTGLENMKAEPSRNTSTELKKEELSMNASSELGAKEWKDEHDAGFQMESGLSKSNSNSNSALHDTCRASTIVGSSNVVKDDSKLEFDLKYDAMVAGPSDLIANKQNAESDATLSGSSQNGTFHGTCQVSSILGSSNAVRDEVTAGAGFDVGKKQGRHARMTSLDLRNHKQTDAGFLQKTRSGSSYSFDASHDPFAARIKVQPSKVVPSSSLPQFFPVENHCKISENSSCRNSGKNLYRGAGGSPPSLDEQLDVNSVAAISAAALQRAIEEAEIRIRLAKEFLEREGQGNSKLSFKDTLKLKVGKENNNANEINEYRPKNVQHRPKVYNKVETCFHSERKSVLESVQVAPAFEGRKKSPMDEEPMEGRNAKVSKSIEESDKREGAGEWEAAKHLNQLISGVKNRIASFMTWQAETEKKEEPKVTEASRNSQQQSQSERELKDAEIFEMKETEKNENTSVYACETKDGESKTGSIPEANELDEHKHIQSNTVQEKVGHKVDKVPDNVGLTRTNFLFFSFSSERPWSHIHLEGGERTQTTGSGEVGVENRQEEEIDAIKNENTQDKSEDANHEGLDDGCMSKDCGKSLQGSSEGEADGIVEEPCSVTGNDRSKLNCDENSCERLKEEHGDNRSEFTREDNHDSSLSEECEDDRGEFTCQENGKQNEEFEDDRSELVNQENERLNDECGNTKSKYNCEEDRRMDEEFRDYRTEFTHLENRRVGDKCGDHRSEFTHKENLVPSEEHEVDRSSFNNEENNDRGPSEKFGSDHSDLAHEEINGRIDEACGEESMSSYHFPETIIAVETDDEREECEEVEEAEDQVDNREHLEEANLAVEIKKTAEATEEKHAKQENERDQGPNNDTEEVAQQMNEREENKRIQSQVNYTEGTENEVADQVGCTLADDDCTKTENGFSSEAEEACGLDESNSDVEETVIPDEESERMMEINNSSSEPEMDSETTVFPDEESEKMMETTNSSCEPKKDVVNQESTQEASESTGEERVLTSFSSENTLESDGVLHLDGADGALPFENFVSHKSETDLDCEKEDIDRKQMEPESEEFGENQTECLNECAETVDVGEAFDVSHHVGEKGSFEAVHRRRRWFENAEKVNSVDRPSILEGDRTSLEIDQEVLEETDLAGGVEIHADNLQNEASDVAIATENGDTLDQEDNRINVEGTHKRRRWFVSKGGEGIPEPPSLFGGIKATSEMDSEIVDESQPCVLSDGFVDHIHTKSEDTLKVAEADVVVNEEKSKQSVEATPRRKRWFESGDKVLPNQQQRGDEDAGTRVDINQEHKEIGDTEKSEEGKDDLLKKTEPMNEVHRDLDTVNKRKKEKEKERIAVERAIREARERAFAEARERARRDAVERPKMEGNQRVGSGGQDRLGKATSDATSASDKASMEAKIKAERAAVERATAEARERALQKALSEKASHRLREPAGRHQPERNSSFDPKYHSSSSHSRCSDPSNKGEKLDGADGESAQRRKARLERQKRTMERAAKALEEKNNRDLQAQKEQAARNNLADAVDAEVKRWSSGKEGNLRALLSTLQYILGPDSGWQAISLIDLVAPTAVRKAYKKATLCVHPDKLQQRGASIQQKYICEKVFDLLKEAWSKFNPDER